MIIVASSLFWAFIGDVGKTSLAIQCVHAIVEHVDAVVWRSLLNAQPLDDLLPELIQTLVRLGSCQSYLVASIGN